jgi:hypothetical protein
MGEEMVAGKGGRFLAFESASICTELPLVQISGEDHISSLLFNILYSFIKALRLPHYFHYNINSLKQVAEPYT